jgi:amino acid transporter
VTATGSTNRDGLARRRLGTGSLTIFLISASGPMTVLVGGVVTTFAVTGNVGTPLSYPILAVALALFSVGYAAMSRYVQSAGGFYPYVAQGLGPSWGVAASFVALVSYNAAQIGLVGLFGVVSGDFAERHLHVAWPWWVWSFGGLTAVAALGVRKVDLNAKALLALLACEVGAVLVFDAGSLSHPADGAISLAGLAPGNLFVPGLGGVFAFGVAGYLGFEQGAVYSEEARDPKRTVARATYVTVAITGVLYTVSAWALIVGVGPGRIVAQAQDPGSGIPFSLMAAHFGAAVGSVANALLVTSVFACMLSIHNCVARYIFAMSRDRVVSARLVHTGKRSAAPVAGSLIQSLVATATVLAFLLLGRNPLTELFTWLTYIAAVGVLLLMAATSVAVVGFFGRRPGLESTAWQRLVAPVLATAVLVVIVGVTVANADSVLGTAAGSVLGKLLPGLVGVSAVGGIAWGLVLRRTRPETYARIGNGIVDAPMPDVLAPSIPAAAVRWHIRPGAYRPRRWVPSRIVAMVAEQFSALYMALRLWPLWRQIHEAMPEVALLPRYRGLAAVRSVLRHAPLLAIRMQVEILDGCAALAPWMSTEVLEVARREARRHGLTGLDLTMAVEAAALAAAARARSQASPPASAPGQRATFFALDAPAEVTLARLVRVAGALRRSPVVPATLRQVGANATAAPGSGRPAQRVPAT